MYATTGFDVEKAEAFAGKMLSTLNGAAVALMTSVGHRTGLFDVMAGRPPADSGGIAAESRRTPLCP